MRRAIRIRVDGVPRIVVLVLRSPLAGGTEPIDVQADVVVIVALHQSASTQPYKAGCYSTYGLVPLIPVQIPPDARQLVASIATNIRILLLVGVAGAADTVVGGWLLAAPASPAVWFSSPAVPSAPRPVIVVVGPLEWPVTATVAAKLGDGTDDGMVNMLTLKCKLVGGHTKPRRERLWRR